MTTEERTKEIKIEVGQPIDISSQNVAIKYTGALDEKPTAFTGTDVVGYADGEVISSLSAVQVSISDETEEDNAAVTMVHTVIDNSLVTSNKQIKEFKVVAQNDIAGPVTLYTVNNIRRVAYEFGVTKDDKKLVCYTRYVGTV